MKRILFLTVILLIGITFGEYVPYQDALKTANHHIKTFNGENPYVIDGEGFKLILDDARPAAWIFNLKPAGYIAIASDDRFYPIIAYSTRSAYRPFSENNIMQSIIKTDIRNRYDLLDNYTAELIDVNRNMWARYLDSDPELILEIDDYIEYGPWIKDHWSQGEPYNAYCPIDPETGERCVTGCTQTACAMILNYWAHPEEIILTEDDNYTSRYTSPGIDMDGPSASLDEIIYSRPGTTGPSMDMVARLMLAIGIVNQASYSSGATAAEISDRTYRNRLDYIDADDVSPLSTNFFGRMAQSIIAGKPVQMSMLSFEDGGHSIVTDGWREDDYFHLNMGWGGYEDGWYHLSSGGLPEGYRWITRTSIDITAPLKTDVPATQEEAHVLYFMDVPQKYLNSIEDYDDVDLYKFHADYDSIYAIYTDGPRDCRIEIFNEAGEIVAEADTGGTLWNFNMLFEAPSDGYYYASITAADTLWESNYQLYYYKMPGPERSFIQLIYPTGGERVIGGETMSVYFTKGGDPYIEYVKAEYSIDGTEGPWTLIADSIATNSLRWNLPVYTGDKRHCYIRVSACENDHIHDINPSAFRIRDPEAIFEQTELPDDFSFDAYPNPFNASCMINAPEGAIIKIFDISGQQVDEMESGGKYQKWQPLDNTESGIYFIETIYGGKIYRDRVSYIR